MWPDLILTYLAAHFPYLSILFLLLHNFLYIIFFHIYMWNYSFINLPFTSFLKLFIWRRLNCRRMCMCWIPSILSCSQLSFDLEALGRVPSFLISVAFLPCSHVLTGRVKWNVQTWYFEDSLSTSFANELLFINSLDRVCPFYIKMWFLLSGQIIYRQI